MPNLVSRCLQLLTVVGATRATATTMDFDGPDSVAPFVSSLKVNDQTATSITQILNDSASAQKNGEASRAFSTAGIACAISKLVFEESTLLDQTAVDLVVEKSWTQTCWLQPKCIITPQNSVQVFQALKIASFLRTGFSVRSGGHSPNPGWASVTDAVLIDLGNLNHTKISHDQRTVHVGPGAKWTDVVAYLDPFGVTALAGRQPFVGVGGYTLGGGVSHFAPQYGLAADTLQNAEVVLADGSIVQANPSTNADLFWALKGGGANFGVVTSFDFRTIPIKDIWFQSSLYAPDQAHALLDAFAAFQKVDDPKASVILSLSPTFATVGLVYAAPVAQPAAFNAFYSVPILQAVLPGTMGTVLQLNNIIASLQNPIPQRHDYRGVSSRVDAQLYKDVYDFWVQKAVEVGHKTGANATFVPQHIPKGMVDVGYANGGNALGLSRETQQWWTTIMDWEKPEHDDLVRSLGIETTAKWVELSKQRGLHLPFVYMNDASRDQDPLGSYAPDNIARLKAIARKYDPLGVFQKVQNAGFLLKDV